MHGGTASRATAEWQSDFLEVVQSLFLTGRREGTPWAWEKVAHPSNKTSAVKTSGVLMPPFLHANTLWGRGSWLDAGIQGIAQTSPKLIYWTTHDWMKKNLRFSSTSMIILLNSGKAVSFWTAHHYDQE